MAVEMEDVRAELDREEPDYGKAAELGPDAIPHLTRLVSDADPLLASKAAYLAGAIDDRRSMEPIELAAKRPEPEVRVAAAAAVRGRSRLPGERLAFLLGDGDPGVRKVAIRSLLGSPSAREQVLERVRQIAEEDPDKSIREVAANALTPRRRREKTLRRIAGKALSRRRRRATP
jgi:HEAT repeat protein